MIQGACAKEGCEVRREGYLEAGGNFEAGIDCGGGGGREGSGNHASGNHASGKEKIILRFMQRAKVISMVRSRVSRGFG